MALLIARPLQPWHVTVGSFLMLLVCYRPLTLLNRLLIWSCSSSSSLWSQYKDFLKAGKGVYKDLRRRLPLYPSDFTDGNYLIFLPCSMNGSGVWFSPVFNHFYDAFRYNWERSLSAEVHHHGYFPLHRHSAACYRLWLAERRKHKRRDRWGGFEAFSHIAASVSSTAIEILSFVFFCFFGRRSEDHCWPEHRRSDLCFICWVTTCHSTHHCPAGHLHQRCVLTSVWSISKGENNNNNDNQKRQANKARTCTQEILNTKFTTV